jgi:peptidoglycan DL-endopeptidase CwlO
VGTRSLSSALARVFRSFSVPRTRRSRGVAVSFAVVTVGALVMASGAASAAPKPTAAQVQQKLRKLSNELQQLDQRYDQVKQQVSSANQQLGVANTAAARYETRFKSMRAVVAQIAATAYEEGSINSPEALLTSNNPQKILDQSSILLELSSDNSAEMSAFLTAARQLSNAQASARRVRNGILALKNNLAKQKASLNKLINQQQSLLNQLSPAQQTGIGPGGAAPTGGGTIGAPDPLPDLTQGEKAVAFAFSKIGCPYVFGGTGPCADGYDCSGLTQAAWAAAGVAIPRTSEEQATLPAVPEADLEPGDILEFLGDGHVGIYVGGGKLIDAPQTGEDVQEVSFTGWYQENFDGAVRP